MVSLISEVPMFDQQDLFINKESEIILDHDGKCEIFYNLIEEDFFTRIYEETPWKQDKITLYGKTHDVPRLQSWHSDKGDRYSYSGIQLTPNPLEGSIKILKDIVEKKTGHEFNSVLINLYRDGRDYAAWHSDDEKELGRNPVIASLSLGHERRFVLKHKTNKGVEKVAIDLPDKSLLLMSGSLQHNWKHQLNKTAKQVGPRINLTFRKIIS